MKINKSSTSFMAKTGFTLVELLIVIAILIILIGIVVAYFRGQIFKGTDAKQKSDINRISVALEEYEKDHNCYPPPNLVLCDKPAGNPGSGLKPYLDIIPCDPINGKSYTYNYDGSVCPRWYKVYTVLQNLADPAVTPGIGPGSLYNYYQGSPNGPVPAAGVRSTPLPTGSGGGSGGPNESSYYGCRSGVCVSITYDPSRPGAECDPNFESSNCLGKCGSLQAPENECEAWK